MNLLREGERYARIKALSLSLKFLMGLRGVAVIFVFTIIGTIVFTASVFSILVYWVTIFSLTGKIPFDIFIGIALAVAAMSLGFMVWTLREKRWLRAFKIHEALFDRFFHHN